MACHTGRDLERIPAEVSMKEAIDPVCEMTVDVETAPFKTEYNGVTYFFCAAGCLRTFQENPAEFVA